MDFAQPRRWFGKCRIATLYISDLEYLFEGEYVYSWLTYNNEER